MRLTWFLALLSWKAILKCKGHITTTSSTDIFQPTPKCTIINWPGNASKLLQRIRTSTCCNSEDLTRSCADQCRLPATEYWPLRLRGSISRNLCISSWQFSLSVAASHAVNGAPCHGHCSFGNEVQYDFNGKPTAKHMVTWLSELECRFRYGQLQQASAAAILKSLRLCSVSAVLFADDQDATATAGAVSQVLHRWYPSACGLMVEGQNPEAVSLRQVYGVSSAPAIVLLRRFGGQTDILHIPHHATTIPELMEFYAWSMLLPLARLTQNKFKATVLEPEQGYVPLMVAFYSYWCADVRQYLKAFATTSQHLGTDVRSAVVDVTEHSSALLFLTKFSPTRYPFLLLFYPRMDGYRVVEVAYSELDVVTPSPAAVLECLSHMTDFIQSTQFNVLKYLTWGHGSGKMSYLSEGPRGSMCFLTSSNLTDSSHSIQRSTSLPAPGKLMETNSYVKRAPLHFGIRVADEDEWQSLMGLTDATDQRSLSTASSSRVGSAGGKISVRTIVAIFIRVPCRSCENNMQTFADFRIAAENFSGPSVSIYLINCSDSTDLCLRLGVHGYPSLAAFRSQKLKTAAECLTERTVVSLSHGRLDYHGVLTVKELMNWFTTSAADPVSQADSRVTEGASSFHDQGPDVLLTATLMPRDLRFLPAGRKFGWQYFFPLRCFTAVCEILFGMVKCITKHSSAAPLSAFEADDGHSGDQIVSQVELARKDGFRTRLMQLQRPLMTLLEEETSRTEHRFHAAHKYNLPQDMTCEDNHSLCVDYLVQFTQGHGRLPVTHMTPDMFHVRNGLLGTADLPVLVVLMHPDNFTVGSKFGQTLQEVAVAFYESICVVTVDITVYPGWVGQFVPVDDRLNLRHDTNSCLYRYPRFCLVHWSDHTKAAFYPPLHPSAAHLDDHLTVQGLTGFVRRFLNDSESMLLATDRF